MTSATSSEKNTEPGYIMNDRDVDVAAHLTARATDVVLDPQECLRLRRKIDWHLMPLMCLLYLVQFTDKTTLGQSAILGLLPSTHIDQNQFNWLGTIFYLSYLVFQYPQNLALQHFPVAKWMSLNIFIWSIALCCHAACTSFGGLFACRFILGMCEGSITPAFMLVTSMFYTRDEQTRRVGYWFLMNGSAFIFLGFISFGFLHTNNHNFRPWQWLVVVTGALTFVLAALFWLLFPDSPTSAWFLTPEERILAVQRIKVNQAGVENKHFKREQFIETFKDPKTYIMFFIAAFSQIGNALTNQRSIIVNQFGFTPLQTTLLGCVDGVLEILVILLGVILAAWLGFGRGYAGAILYIPGIVGAVLVTTLPEHHKVGLLLSYYTAIFFVGPFVIFLSWVGQITAGHTKRTTTNATVLCGYAIGNAVGPQMFQKKYQPRNHIPWALIAMSCFISGVLLLVLRFYLHAENQKRKAEGHGDEYDDVYISHMGADGQVEEKKVDKAFLDLTDRQNRDFFYVL